MATATTLVAKAALAGGADGSGSRRSFLRNSGTTVSCSIDDGISLSGTPREVAGCDAAKGEAGSRRGRRRRTGGLRNARGGRKFAPSSGTLSRMAGPTPNGSALPCSSPSSGPPNRSSGSTAVSGSTRLGVPPCSRSFGSAFLARSNSSMAALRVPGAHRIQPDRSGGEIAQRIVGIARRLRRHGKRVEIVRNAASAKVGLAEGAAAPDVGGRAAPFRRGCIRSAKGSPDSGAGSMTRCPKPAAAAPRAA